MITSKTAANLWNCYREIRAGRKLLADMAKAAKEHLADKTAPSLSDVFGQRRHLQLGIPAGESCHQLLDIAPDLAATIIKAHIANKQAELTRLNEAARVELDLEDDQRGDSALSDDE